MPFGARCIVFLPYHSKGVRFFVCMLLLKKSPSSTVKYRFSPTKNKTGRKNLLKQMHEEEAEFEGETEDYRGECPLGMWGLRYKIWEPSSIAFVVSYCQSIVSPRQLVEAPSRYTGALVPFGVAYLTQLSQSPAGRACTTGKEIPFQEGLGPFLLSSLHLFSAKGSET